MRIEWDEKKNDTNRSEHGIDFETAQLIFDDPYCVTFVEPIAAGEQRWHVVRSIGGRIVLFVVHTYREEASQEVIPFVSPRRASRRQRKLQEQAIG